MRPSASTQQPRRLARDHLRGAEQVGEGTEVLLHVPRGLLHHLGIEPDARELHEVLPVHPAEIDLARVAGLDHAPGLARAGRQAELRGEDIHRADGQDAERDIRAGDAIDHLIHRAVAAGGHDHAEALLHGIGGDRAGLARLGGRGHGGARRAGGRACAADPPRARPGPRGLR